MNAKCVGVKISKKKLEKRNSCQIGNCFFLELFPALRSNLFKFAKKANKKRISTAIGAKNNYNFTKNMPSTIIKTNTKIPSWTLSTIHFLKYFDDKKQNQEEPYTQIFNKYLKDTKYVEGEFPLINSASILMGLYGIFVFPKEFWKRFFSDDEDNKVDKAEKLLLENSNFEFGSKLLFIDCDGKQSSQLSNPVFFK